MFGDRVYLHGPHDKPGSQRFCDYILKVWSASQPAAAAGFVVQEIPPGPVQTEAAISLLHQWAIRDFNGAMAWVELFPDGDIRQRAIKELAGVRNYSISDDAPMPVSGGTPPTR